MKRVFIDGSAGTTGLRIYERLGNRFDIELVSLSPDDRKDADARKRILNSVDIAFLCLPDAAAVEAADMIENENTVIIDTSTAHRTSPEYAYGFAELGAEFEEKIRNSKRIAVPGCHASGFISLVYPLIESGILPKSALLTCHSVTGYSGGGKKMIADYEAAFPDFLLGAPRQYGLTQSHKHLPEMQAITGLETAPIFCPIVSDFYSGMVATVPVFASQLEKGKTVQDIKDAYEKKYPHGGMVEYKANIGEDGFLSANGMHGKDKMEVAVLGNDERILLVSRFDNLGKGASGAAVECMNIVMGTDKFAGLEF